MTVLASSPSSTASATVAVSSWWLMDPTSPGRNINIYPETPVKTSNEEEQQIFQPLGRTREVIVADAVVGEHLKLDLWFTTAAGWTAFELLRKSQRVLLLKSSGTEQWYGRIGPQRDRTILPTPDLSWRSAGIMFIETDPV